MVDIFCGSGNNYWSPNWKALFDLSDISEKTRSHLSRVYLTLLSCVVSSVLGMYSNSAIIISGFIWSIIMLLLSCYLFYQVNHSTLPESSRVGFLLALAFMMGFEVGPFVHIVADVNPGLIMQAGAYTATVFSSFSAIALFS